MPAGFGRGNLIIDFGEGTAVDPSVNRTASSNGMRAWIDGPVREAAVVYVNGRRAGSVWSAPYRVNVSGLLKDGTNDIRVAVANLAVNHMAGRPLPNYSELNKKYGVRFEAQDMNKIRPEPAGLMGPIRLISVAP